MGKGFEVENFSLFVYYFTMKILSTNDDGFECDGIKVLSAALRRAGHKVVVVAPDRDRSGSSHSMSLANGYIDIMQIGDDAWKCSGTPVDCVLAAISGNIDFMPDVVVSGINAGCNLGTDILFSGTAAAARQGALLGLPSIAFSMTGDAPFCYDAAARWAMEHFDTLIGQWQKDMFFNINFPPPNAPNAGSLQSGGSQNSDGQRHADSPQSSRSDLSKQISSDSMLTFPSKRQYTDKIEKIAGADGWTRLNFIGLDVETKSEAGSDVDAINQNRISISPVYVHPINAVWLCWNSTLNIK
jgi:5'-nucleotidase